MSKLALDRSVAPAVADFAPVGLQPQHTELLPNGIALHIVNFGDQPAAQLSVVWEGGRYDVHRAVAVQIMAQAMLERTAAHSPEELADIIDFNGAKIRPLYAPHYTGFELTVLNSNLAPTLGVFADMMLHPDFDESTVQMLVRKAAARRAVEQKEVTYAAAVRLHRQLVGKQHPSAIIETPEQIATVTSADLSRAYDDTIALGRAEVYLSGSLAESDIDLVRRFVASLPTPAAKSPIKPTVRNCPSAAGICYELREQAMQSAVQMGMPVIDRGHPDFIDLAFAADALGGYFNSRLMQNIREEKGLTYGISSTVSASLDGANFYVEAQCDAAYVEQVIEQTRIEMLDLRNNPPVGEELQRLRFAIWSRMAKVSESAFRTANYHLNQLVYSRPEGYFESQMQHLLELSPERIAQVAERWLDPENLRIVVAGNH